MWVLPLIWLVACDPYAAWPELTSVYPWVHDTEEDLPPYALVRVETETWTPLVDAAETALYVQKATFHKPSAGFDTLVHFGRMRSRIPALDPADVRFSFVGDVMRIGGNWDSFATGVAHRLEGVRVGNLETPVSPAHPVDRGNLIREHGLYAFNSPPSLLAGLPLDVVQINNNHTLDLGDSGVAHTLKQVYQHGLTPVGPTNNVAWASRGEVTAALLSYTWGSNVQAASAYDLHVVPFGHLEEPIDLSDIGSQVSAARRAGATHVVLLVHWGFEYEYYPDPHFLQLGRRLIALGADLVVGTGPHAVEPAEICDVNRPLTQPQVGVCAVRTPDGVARTAAILYSLGDFGTELATVPLEVGIIATVSLRRGAGVTGLGWEAVASVPAEGPGESLVLLDDLVDDPVYAEEAARLNQLLGTSWRR